MCCDFASSASSSAEKLDYLKVLGHRVMFLRSWLGRLGVRSSSPASPSDSSAASPQLLPLAAAPPLDTSHGSSGAAVVPPPLLLEALPPFGNVTNCTAYGESTPLTNIAAAGVGTMPTTHSSNNSPRCKQLGVPSSALSLLGDAELNDDYHQQSMVLSSLQWLKQGGGGGGGSGLTSDQAVVGQHVGQLLRSSLATFLSLG